MVAATSPSVVLSAVFHQICLCLWLHYCHSAEKVNRATWGTWIKNKKEEKTIAATQKNLNRTEPNSNSFLTTKYRFSLQKIYSVAWHYDATSRLLLLWLVVANDKLSGARGRTKYATTTSIICTTIHLQKVLPKSTKITWQIFSSYITYDLSCKSKQNETLIVKANSLCNVYGIFFFLLFWILVIVWTLTTKCKYFVEKVVVIHRGESQ